MLYWHYAHNLVLVFSYAMLGTMLLTKLVDLIFNPLMTSYRKKIIWQGSSAMFLIGCAWTHGELFTHADQLPADFFSLSHNIFGSLQALGAVVFVGGVLSVARRESRD